MAFFRARLTHARFVYSPLSSEQMLALGDFMCDTKISRIKRAINSSDQPAKPLKEATGRNAGRGYPQRKIKHGLAPIRDWTWTGRTLRSLKSKRANENEVTIGFTTDQADLIALVNERRESQFAASPSDKQAFHAYLAGLLKQHRSVRLVKRTA